MTVPPESALWMEGVDSKDGSKDGAISPAANRSAALRAEPLAASQAKPAATIAGALEDLRGLAIGLAAALFVIFAYGALA